MVDLSTIGLELGRHAIASSSRHVSSRIAENVLPCPGICCRRRRRPSRSGGEAPWAVGREVEGGRKEKDRAQISNRSAYSSEETSLYEACRTTYQAGCELDRERGVVG